MKLQSYTTTKCVTISIFTVEHDTGSIIYKELVDQDGRLINSLLQTIDGDIVEDSELLLQVQIFLNDLFFQPTQNKQGINKREK